MDHAIQNASKLPLQLREIVLLRQEPSTVVARRDDMLPSQFRLEQNHPIPFNPTTTIGFALPRAAHVELRVYNHLGQEVAVLVDEVRQPGEFQVQWHAGELPSGVYVYRLRAGGYEESRKLLMGTVGNPELIALKSTHKDRDYESIVSCTVLLLMRLCELATWRGKNGLSQRRQARQGYAQLSQKLDVI